MQDNIPILELHIFELRNIRIEIFNSTVKTVGNVK